MNAFRTLATGLALLATGVAVSAQGLTLLTPTNTTWRYLADGSDQGTAWQLPGFDDSAWPQGKGLFGNENNYPYPINTPIPGLTPITVYYRTHFPWAGGVFGVTLAGTNYVDDGSILYLNGVEIARFNMPEGPAAFDTLAPVANPGGYPNLNQGEPVLVHLHIPLDSLTNGNANPLVAGDNVLAVEVHQNAVGSSDRVFGLSLFTAPDFPCNTDGIQPTNRTILESRSTTFIVNPMCFPAPQLQWYRNVGFGEELIPGATASSFTLTNAQDIIDEGVYYCRLTTPSGVMDSRHAVLVIDHDDIFPQFISAAVVAPGLNMFRLVTDEQLCGDPLACGTDFRIESNWQILESDNPSVDLGVETVVMINPTTYEFTTAEPRDPVKRYQITVHPLGELSDMSSNRVPAGTFAETYPTVTFQQGVASYAGTEDAEVHSNASADTPLGALPFMKVDADDTGVAQGLLRFDSIFGFGMNRIPLGRRIISATLTLNQIDPGSHVNLHRMLVSWNQSTATWNSLLNGISADDVEARFLSDTTKPVGTSNGRVDLDVTSSVQAWSEGQPNHGWALLPLSIDGWSVSTSESGGSTVPILTVAYEGHCDCGAPVIVTQPPATLSVHEFQSFAISVSVSNAFGTLQWTKDGVDIPNAHGATLVIVSAAPADAGSYRLRVSNPAGSVASDPCIVSVIPDQTRLYVTRVVSSANGTNITIVFNEPVGVATAQSTANYNLSPAVAVANAILGANNTVTLTTARRSVGTTYSLRIADVSDTAAIPNVMDPNPTFVNLTTASILAGATWTSEWMYNTNNLDGTPEWKTATFVPGADWRSGTGLFGVEPSSAVLAAAPVPIATPLAPNAVAPGDALVTTYFRKTVGLPALPTGARYVIGHYTDDGFVAYLDGEEIHRFAMPAGAVTFTNRSTGIPTGEATYRSFTFDTTPGLHTLAVELHQAGFTSSDVLFGMEVRMIGGAVPSLSIAHSVNGGLKLNWNADDNWRLRKALALDGPYTDVPIPVSGRLGNFILPNGPAINSSAFYRLEYICHP